jgi:flagellar biosynthesis/type III secretory pathway chaperone
MKDFLDEKYKIMNELQKLKDDMEEKEIKEKKMKELNRQLEFQVDELMEQLETADQARKEVKEELQKANDKII